MNIESGMINDNIELDTELKLNGMINGNVTILEQGTLHLHGIVNGNVTNKGGKLNIFGTINGYLYEENGITNIDLNAIIKNN